MGFDHQLTYLFAQLTQSLPVFITLVVIGIVVAMRRDAGLWWKLALGGVAVLILSQLVSTVGTFFLGYLDNGYRYYWIASVPSLILQVLGLGLLGAGAISGRRGQTVTR
ncbi:MAG: hypothetical protein L0G89_08625 [Janibacter sp.]|nr:hypothetical protein [Janibacter sp.]